MTRIRAAAQHLVTTHRKTLLALVGAGVVILGRAVGVDSTLYVDATAVLTALGVFSVPNTPA